MRQAHKPSCGCVSAAIGAVTSTIFFIYSYLIAPSGPHSTQERIWIGLAYFFTGAVAGKIFGILTSRLRPTAGRSF